MVKATAADKLELKEFKAQSKQQEEVIQQVKAKAKNIKGFKFIKGTKDGITPNEFLLIDHYEQQLADIQLSMTDEGQKRKEQVETCKDQASKIVDLKHEISLIISFISSVNLVNALDKKEAVYAMYGLLVREGGLKNISRTLEAKLGDLEEMACTLFDIDEDGTEVIL